MTDETETWQDRLSAFSADYYYRPDVFAAEVGRVFEPSWLCVGFTQDVANHQDFITRQIAGHNLVVQNFHGELKAFRNVCSHRFSRIQCAEKGNRPLTCPYHGWTYDKAGVPAGIPLNKQSFGFSDDDRKALALRDYALEIVGHFIFVRMTPEGPDLHTFLGGIYEALSHLSETCPDPIERLDATWAFNWKIGIDNAAEGYHVPLVHPGSYGTVLEPRFDIYPAGAHIYYTGQFKTDSQAWWRGIAKALKLTPSSVYPQYACFMIFPNMVVNVNCGSCLSALILDPLEPQKVAANSGLWLAAGRKGPAHDMAVQSIKAFSLDVRREDHDICVAVQQGVADMSESRAPLLGEMEIAVRHFHQTYAACMDGALP